LNELDASWRFEVSTQDRCATRTEPFKWGTAIFQSRVPRVYDQNLLRVERGFGEIDARGLESEADRLQRPAGLAHRKVLVPDADAGRRLWAEFTDLSWRRARNVVMAHHGGAPDESDHVVREVLPRELREARTRAFAEDLGSTAAEQVATSLELIADAVASARGFAVEVDDEAVSWCVLYEEDGVAEIDDVVTAMAFRRRGFAKAVVSAATRASLESGNELTFLLADDEDWPKELYARLGFEPIGFRFEFTRV
jgi:ribosomal protein S18 acetylase RimI-like enzyme